MDSLDRPLLLHYQQKLLLVTLSRAAVCLLFGFLVACTSNPDRAPSIGEAYVGPTSLTLRQDLTAKSPIAATVKHGDKLNILEYRYRLVRLRTSQGAEGWADMRQLLTPDQMAGLRHMAESSSQFPSQGLATVYEPVNMHTDSSRSSPSFWQIAENAKVDVIGHKLAPRVQSTPVYTPPPKAASPKKKSKDRPQVRIGPPPRPPAPKPPANWLALSVPKLPASDSEEQDAPKPEPRTVAVVPMDDWSLVRTHDGKVGWVLTSRLSMAIPDEVAQYAEGHRITSYFSLGQNRDGDSVKHNWLWTTITKGLQPYEFDSFRVFIWNPRRHRYETAYIERNVIGHFPIEVKTSGAAPSFCVIVEAKDGRLVRKTYSFEGYRIRVMNKEPVDAARPIEPAKTAAIAPEKRLKERSWFARAKDRMRGLFR